MWAERALARMEELGLQQKHLASRLGISRSRLGHYIRGRRPVSADFIVEVAQALGCSASWLLEGDASVERGPDIRASVPELDWVQAGRPESLCESSTLEDARDYHPSPFPSRPCLFCVRIRGASMEPRFREGDLVYIDPEEEPTHNKFVVVLLDGHTEATFKQLIIEGGRKYLMALNPDWPERVIEIDGNARICGVAVFKGEHL